MAYKIEKISSNQVQLDFTVSAEKFSEAMQKAYLKLKNRINVPGFRKGKAPRKMIENMYTEAVFYDEALDIIIPEVYKEAIDAEKLEIVDKPDVDVKEIGSGKDLTFTLKVYVSPDVELGDYKALKATKYLPKVTEEQINARIEEDVKKVTTSQEIEDRPVKEGDTVNLDYAGSVDGVPFEGGTAKGQSLKIGSKQFIPGFEEQMIGMKLGEEKDLNVTFPSEYHAEKLAGKAAVFHVKVNKIEEEVRPELNDDFAGDVSEAKTFEEYKKGIEKELKEGIEKQAQLEVENDLVQAAVDASDCDIPEAMIAEEVEMQLRNMKYRMMYQGIRYEDFLKYTGQTEEDAKEQLKPQAKETVKTSLVLEAIAKKEDIKVSEEEVLEAIKEYAKDTGRNEEKFIEGLNENQKANFELLAKNKKVVKLLLENAKVTTKRSARPQIHDHELKNVVEETEKAVENAENE